MLVIKLPCTALRPSLGSSRKVPAGIVLDVRSWPEPAVHCDATIRPESGVNRQCPAHARYDVIDPKPTSSNANRGVPSGRSLRQITLWHFDA